MPLVVEGQGEWGGTGVFENFEGLRWIFGGEALAECGFGDVGFVVENEQEAVVAAMGLDAEISGQRLVNGAAGDVVDDEEAAVGSGDDFDLNR